jgi:hypothetical protein
MGDSAMATPTTSPNTGGNILGSAFMQYGQGTGSKPDVPAANVKNPAAQYEYGQAGRMGRDTDGDGFREVDCSALVYNAMRNAGYLSQILLCIFLIGVCNLTSAKEPPAVRDCCGDENYVYRPSADRIPITNSPNLNKRLSELQAKPNELDQLRKTIKAGNYVLQAYVNKDLFRWGSDQEPPEIKEGWLKYYAPYVAVGTDEFEQILKKRSPDCCYAGVSKDPRHGRLVCPFARLNSVNVLSNKTILTYQFIHIARHRSIHGFDPAKYPLELNDIGKVGAFSIALNKDLKFVPNDPDTPDWWSMVTTKGFKDRVKNEVDSKNKSDQPHIPKYKKLQAELIEAEQICQQKNLFDR